MTDVEWRKYDEKNPWGKNSKGSTVIGIEGDNIEFSQMRWEAIRAVRERRATPEQVALVREADSVYQQILGEEE